MDAIEIRNELERILASRCFRSRRVLRRFLSYIVEATLAGESLTQQTIAINALGQSKDFNDLDNPLVRVHAGRLRKQLEEYYATEGYFNTVRISLPLGSYQPEFTPYYQALPALYENKNSSLSLGPNLVYVPRNFTSDPNNWAFIASLSRDYVTALSHFSFFQTLFIDEIAAQTGNWPDDLQTKHKADFGVFLDLYLHENNFQLKCSLVHSITTEIIWAHSFDLGAGYPHELVAQQIFKRISHDTLSYERGIAHDYWARYLLSSDKTLSPQHQVLVMIRPYAWDITAQNFRTALLMCEERLRRSPNDVTALIINADHCRIEYLLKYNYTPNLQEKLRWTVERLQRQAPYNAYTYLFTGFLYMLEDDLEAASEAAEKAHLLNPLDTHLHILAGLLYMAVGQWDKGAAYVKNCIETSHLYPDWYHVPLSIYHYQQGRYLDAIREAKNIKFKHLWGPMLRSALYERNNLQEKSLKEYNNILDEYPDFDERQHKLTDNFTSQSQIVIHKIWSHLPKKPSS